MCEWLLERVKKDVQVWKREWYGASAPAPASSAIEQGMGEEGSIYEGKVDGEGEDGPYVAKDGQAGGLEREVGAMWKANHQRS